jgi:hypothetical protein
VKLPKGPALTVIKRDEVKLSSRLRVLEIGSKTPKANISIAGSLPFATLDEEIDLPFPRTEHGERVCTDGYFQST